jgi:hypothetical protein
MFHGVKRGQNRENHIYIYLYYKDSSSPKPASQFQSNLVQIILGYKELKNVQGPDPLQRGENHKTTKTG